MNWVITYSGLCANQMRLSGSALLAAWAWWCFVVETACALQNSTSIPAIFISYMPPVTHPSPFTVAIQIVFRYYKNTRRSDGTFSVRCFKDYRNDDYESSWCNTWYRFPLVECRCPLIWEALSRWGILWNFTGTETFVHKNKINSNSIVLNHQDCYRLPNTI